MKKILSVIFFSIYTIYFIKIPFIFWNDDLLEAPYIELLWNQQIDHPVWNTFLDPWYMARDAIDGDISKDVIVVGNVDINTVWEYVINYSVVNSKWITSSLQRSVKIVDNVPPKVHLYWKDNIEILINTPYVDEWAYYEDNYYWTWFIEAVWEVDTTKIWENILTYRFTDLSWNLSAELQRKVFVNTWNTPIITLLWDNPYYLEYKNIFIEPWFLVDDVEDKNLHLWNVFITWAIDINTLWEYDVSYYIWDAHWNIQFEQRRVIVADMTQPFITLRWADTVYIPVNWKYDDEGALWTDNYDWTWEVFWNGVIDYWVPWEYKIEYNFIDSQLNIAETKTRTIVILDPSIFRIELLGEQSISLEKYSKYDEQWAKAQDAFWNDISGAIIIEWKVDTTTPWIHHICYSVSDFFLKISKKACREVYVYSSGWWGSWLSSSVIRSSSLLNKLKKTSTLQTYFDEWFNVWLSAEKTIPQEVLESSGQHSWDKNIQAPESDSFGDTHSSLSKKYIEQLLKEGFLDIKGKRLNPKWYMTRAEFLDILFQVHNIELKDTFSWKIFHDLQEWTWQTRVAYTTYDLWISQGYEDATFRPNDNISRVQAIKYVLKLQNEELLDETSQFIDIKVPWMLKYANAAKKIWIVNGEKTPEGYKFYPENLITLEEAAKILYKSR